MSRLMIACCLGVGAAALAPERWFLGPTSNTLGIGNRTLEMMSNASAWSETISAISASGGAVHWRMQIMGRLSAPQLQQLASAVKSTNVGLSIEGGGHMCQPNGTAIAQAQLRVLKPFLDAGGTIKTWGIESVFSRTRQACHNLSLAETVEQVADFAAVLASKLPATKLFLYDALPHYSVGSSWPANAPPPAGAWDMDLLDVLTRLRAAMAQRGAALAGYWADCPLEYSQAYAPKPGHGYERLAAAWTGVRAMGLEFAKTFNTQDGGAASAEAFAQGTLADFRSVSAVVDMTTFYMAMVESWYAHPVNPAPETTPYTTTNTLLAVIKEANTQ
jgi:hypothetical protein